MRTGITNPSRTRLSKEGKISFASVSSILQSSIYLLVAKLTATLHVFFFPSLNTCYLSLAFPGSVARCPNPSVPALLRAKPQEQFGLGLLRVQYAVSCFGYYFLLLKRTLHSLCSGIFIGNICIFTCLQKKEKILIHSYIKFSYLSQLVTQIWQGVPWHAAQEQQGKPSPPRSRSLCMGRTAQ